MPRNVLPNNIYFAFPYLCSLLPLLFQPVEKSHSVVPIFPHIITNWGFYYFFSIFLIPPLSAWIAFGFFSCHSSFSFVWSSTQTQVPMQTDTHIHTCAHFLPLSWVALSRRPPFPLLVPSWLHRWFMQNLGTQFKIIDFHLVLFNCSCSLEGVFGSVLVLFSWSWFFPHFSLWFSIC